MPHIIRPTPGEPPLCPLWADGYSVVKGDGTKGDNRPCTITGGNPEPIECPAIISPPQLPCRLLTAGSSEADWVNAVWNNNPVVSQFGNLVRKETLQATHPSQRIAIFNPIICPLENQNGTEGYTPYDGSPGTGRPFLENGKHVNILTLQNWDLLDQTRRMVRDYAERWANDVGDEPTWLVLDFEYTIESWFFFAAIGDAATRQLFAPGRMQAYFHKIFHEADTDSQNLDWITAGSSDKWWAWYDKAFSHRHAAFRNGVLEPMADVFGRHWIDPERAPVSVHAHYRLPPGQTRWIRNAGGPGNNRQVGYAFGAPHLGPYSASYQFYSFRNPPSSDDYSTPGVGWRAGTNLGSTKNPWWNRLINSVNHTRLYGRYAGDVSYHDGLYSAGSNVAGTWTETTEQKVINWRMRALWEASIRHRVGTGLSPMIPIFNQWQQRYATSQSIGWDSAGSQWNAGLGKVSTAKGLREMATIINTLESPNRRQTRLPPVPYDADSIVTPGGNYDGTDIVTHYTDIFPETPNSDELALI